MRPLTRTSCARCKLQIAVISLLSLFASFLFAAQPDGAAKVKEGANLFERRCTGCHRLDEIRVGPPLRHAFGRQAGSEATFPYSQNLKASRLKWDESTLDRWLTDTDALVPDNDMAFRVSNPEERSAIIAYLKSLSLK